VVAFEGEDIIDLGLLDLMGEGAPDARIGQMLETFNQAQFGMKMLHPVAYKHFANRPKQNVRPDRPESSR